MLTVANAPVPRASMRAKESRVWVASPATSLEPTQIAPESRTIGSKAAASPPASGSSGLARATRLDTTTTFTSGSFGLKGVRLTVRIGLCSAFVDAAQRSRSKIRHFAAANCGGRELVPVNGEELVQASA